MKLLKILLFFAIVATLKSAVAQGELQSAVKNLHQSTEFQHAGISFLAINAETGEKIVEQNPLLGLPPASTAKLFSTAAAIEILGPDYRPKTRIYIDGSVSPDSVLHGNIWIRGGGDMTLGSRFFTQQGHEKDFLKSWVDSITSAGIKQINGKIIADGSEFGYAGVPDGWSWVDIGNYYGAGPSGICLFDNTIRYNFKTGATAGSPTTLINYFPEIPGLTFHNYIQSTNVNDDNSYIYGGPFSNDRFGTGSLPLNRTNYSVKGSMPDPEFQLAYEFEKALKNVGIDVKGGAVGARSLTNHTIVNYSKTFKLLFTHRGQKLIDIARLTNMKSINLFAEGLVCLIGYEKNGNGSTESGIKEIEKYWSTRINTKGLILKDGSGLSRSNGISASHFCELLKYMNTSKFKDAFNSTLPVAGKSGTLNSLCRNQAGQGRVSAKSGTMSKIKSYSGYVQSSTGKKIAFAIILTNFSGSSSNATTKIESILNQLANF